MTFRLAAAFRQITPALPLIAALLGVFPAVSAAQEKVVVFAAASLKNAVDEITDEWQSETGKVATISYAGSSALAKQIEQGAPADVFISADLDWMSYLSQMGLTVTATEQPLVGNRIVLVAPSDTDAVAEIAPGFDLAGLLRDGQLAMANVDAVPAGRYGKAALETLGVWNSVSGRVAQADNVRAALALVATGEAPLGIVYETDAAAEPAVRVVGRFPENTHPPIVYPLALLSGSNNPDAAELVRFLRSPAARVSFERQGFTWLGAEESN